MVFIDGSNLYHSLRDEYSRTDLDFGAFPAALAGEDRDLIRCYYYNALIDQTKDPGTYSAQQRFLSELRRIDDLEVRLGALVYRPNRAPVEKGIDVRIATDMLVNAARGNYDTAILVSGDTDFADALQAVKDFGCKAEVGLFGHPGSSRKLRDVADRVISLAPPFCNDFWLLT